MRTVLFLAPLFAFACTTPAPAPVEPPPAPEPVPVKVEQAPEPAIADCVDLTFNEGVAGTYTVAAGDSHARHHFTMPEGKDALVLTATWPDATWIMDVATGVGDCPHAGVTHATVEGTGSARIFLPASQLAAETTAFTAGETWFLHLASKGEHADGATVTYAVAGQACAIVKPEAPPPQPVAGHPAPAHPQVMKAAPPTTVREKKAEGTGKAAKGK